MQTEPDKPVQAPTKRALVVLGMHRSGTSALTGILEIFGAKTPKQQIKAGAQNARGFFEATRIARLNDRLLGVSDLTWDKFSPLHEDWSATEASLAFFAVAQEILEDEFEDADLIALKDPRICRLVPFWNDALRLADFEPYYVLTLRNPLEVAQSLEVRNKLDISHGLLLWMAYVLDAEANTRGHARVHTSFEQVLDDPITMVGRVLKMLGLPMSANLKEEKAQLKTFLSSDLRHHAVTKLDDLPDNCRALYQVMTRWVESGEDPEDYAFLDRLRLEVQAIAAQDGGAEELHAALALMGADMGDMPLAEHMRAAEKLRKPELVAQNKALLRANAALSKVGGTRADPDGEVQELKEAARAQALELAASAKAIAARDKELGALSHLFIKAKATSEQLQISHLDLEAQAKDAAAKINTLTVSQKSLQKSLDHYTQENTELHALVAKVENKRAKLDSENYEIKKVTNELHALVAKVENKRAALEQENNKLHALVAEVETARHALITSTSWRMGRPIRLVGKVLRRLRR